MTKNFLSLVLLLSAVQLIKCMAKRGDHPSEFAPYTLMIENKDYQIRSYPELKWVCREHNGNNFPIRHQADLFFSLHEYFMGSNSADAKMNMSGPVTVSKTMNGDNQGDAAFQMCIYIQQNFQNEPPQPIEEGVYVFSSPPLTVAVKVFNSYKMPEVEYARQWKMLTAALKANNEPDVNFDTFIGASYDPPFAPNARPNEVWMLKNV